MDHLWLKVVHIVSATLVLGTGLGIAFFMWTAHRTGDARVIASVARNVVIADSITAPGVVGLVATGILMANNLGVPFWRGWLSLALALFVLVGFCWLPVLWLQKRAWRIARTSAHTGTPLPDSYYRLMRWWFWLGWPAFAAVLGIVALMVLKPG